MKTTIKSIIILVCLNATFLSSSIAQSYNVYMGLLHAHTCFSDGSGTPEEAFAMAKREGLNFFAITEHNHDQAEAGAKERRDGILIATNKALYNGSKDLTITRNWIENGTSKKETITVKPLIKAATAATSPNFLAIYGQEFSTISSGNHVNVFGIDSVLTVSNGDFKSLCDMLDKRKRDRKSVPLLQLNHPDVYSDLFAKGSSAKNMFNDYGIGADNLGPHFKTMVARLDPYVSLIEVLSGPALNAGPVVQKSYDANENDYFFYLKQGFHISPSAGQDNHYKTWGQITSARVGVLAKSLSQNDLAEGVIRNRTFATEDKNLQAFFTVNDSLMGSSIRIPDEAPVAMKLMIKDSDEPSASYTLEVYSSSINPELSTNATNWKDDDGLIKKVDLKGSGPFIVNNLAVPAEASFMYVKLIQNDGDRLWTAPIWINEVSAASSSVNGSQGDDFYWSKASTTSLYHKKGCSLINRIKSENLMKGSVPPVGRSAHDCDVMEDIH